MAWENSGTTFEQAPVGAHLGLLVKIVDLGTQEGEYQGKKTQRRQNILTWELPNELRDDGKPFIISKFYTASLSEKSNLTKDLTSWLGKAPPKAMTNDEIKALLGKACQVVVIAREGSDKHVVSAVVSVPKGITLPEKPVNDLTFFSLDSFNEDTFNSLGQGLQNMIMKSPEYARIVNGDAEDINQTTQTDDIPF